MKTSSASDCICKGHIFGCNNCNSDLAKTKLNNLCDTMTRLPPALPPRSEIHKNNLNSAIALKPSFATVKHLNHCQHSSSLETSSMLDHLVMFIKRPRSKKKILLWCLSVILIFTFATSLPFIVEKLQQPSSVTQISPLSSIYHHFHSSVHHARPSSSSDNSLLGQVFISVKTTSQYHYPRLVILMETWISQAKDAVWIFTDGEEDHELRRILGDHLVLTNCSSSHHRLHKS